METQRFHSKTLKIILPLLGLASLCLAQNFICVPNRGMRGTPSQDMISKCAVYCWRLQGSFRGLTEVLEQETQNGSMGKAGQLENPNPQQLSTDVKDDPDPSSGSPKLGKTAGCCGGWLIYSNFSERGTCSTGVEAEHIYLLLADRGPRAGKDNRRAPRSST